MNLTPLTSSENYNNYNFLSIDIIKSSSHLCVFLWSPMLTNYTPGPHSNLRVVICTLFSVPISHSFMLLWHLYAPTAVYSPCQMNAVGHQSLLLCCILLLDIIDTHILTEIQLPYGSLKSRLFSNGVESLVTRPYHPIPLIVVIIYNSLFTCLNFLMI